ncbi:hypothetical protein AB833_16080 [Chromatiales bacterium (ex Bugula neritina AB1)]|nr:hypothetical protein AB833_16080 [Chromatiales bacterium (ex Bugula neritina AB1)]
MNPVLVEVFRNDQLESCHRGAVVALNSSGDTIFELGDINALVFPRSSLKPIQAIPLLESGAADFFELTGQEIALACASHNAERSHQAVLASWMSKLSLEVEDLECGPALPMHQITAHQLLRDGGVAARDLHNCSGKHTGMLTLARFLEQPLQDYSNYKHATQQCWMDVLTELSGERIQDLPWDRDGCGMPAVALPLIAFARALSAFCKPADHSPERARAMHAILRSMNEHADLVAGSDRCCTATMRAHSDLVVKTGAEGVFAAIAPEAGIAIALKVDDGATRASDVVLGATLRKLGVLSEQQYSDLASWYTPSVVNSQKFVTGRVVPSSAWS